MLLGTLTFRTAFSRFLALVSTFFFSFIDILLTDNAKCENVSLIQVEGLLTCCNATTRSWMRLLLTDASECSLCVDSGWNQRWTVIAISIIWIVIYSRATPIGGSEPGNGNWSKMEEDAGKQLDRHTWTVRTVSRMVSQTSLIPVHIATCFSIKMIAISSDDGLQLWR
jgi:hypothetical protein